MDFAKVNVEARNQSGKGAARRSRAAGKAPGILYGHKEAPVAVTVDPLLLVKSMDKQRKRNTVFTLAVSDGNGKTQDVTAMIRDVQIHPLTRRIIHVDFIRISMEDEVKVVVPLHLVGTPVGVVNGGQLHHGTHTVPVAAKPNAIPTHVDVDVSGLDIGTAVHVSDLKLPEGVRVLLDPKVGLASVVAPRQDKADAAAAAAPAEGAAAAADGKAAAPAAGGDKAAAPAAGAKKEGGGDKKGK